MLIDRMYLANGPTLLMWGLLAYYICLAVHRLFLHPLRKFPGEKFAALSGWHWAYHASDSSDYLSALHKKYGAYCINPTPSA